MAGGQKECGIKGCKEAHHLILHCDAWVAMKLVARRQLRLEVKVASEVLSGEVREDEVVGELETLAEDESMSPLGSPSPLLSTENPLVVDVSSSKVIFSTKVVLVGSGEAMV